VPRPGKQVAAARRTQPVELAGVEADPAAVENLVQRYDVIDGCENGAVPEFGIKEI